MCCEMQFLYETPAATPVDDVVKELVDIWNMQIQVSPYLSLPEAMLFGPSTKRNDKRFQLAGPKIVVATEQPEDLLAGGGRQESGI